MRNKFNIRMEDRASIRLLHKKQELTLKIHLLQQLTTAPSEMRVSWVSRFALQFPAIQMRHKDEDRSLERIMSLSEIRINHPPVVSELI